MIDIEPLERILAKSLEGKDLSQMEPVKPRTERMPK